MVGSKGNRATKEYLIALLRKNAIKGSRRNFPLFDKPDCVFRSEKVGVLLMMNFGTVTHHWFRFLSPM